MPVESLHVNEDPAPPPPLSQMLLLGGRPHILLPPLQMRFHNQALEGDARLGLPARSGLGDAVSGVSLCQPGPLMPLFQIQLPCLKLVHANAPSGLEAGSHGDAQSYLLILTDS